MQKIEGAVGAAASRPLEGQCNFNFGYERPAGRSALHIGLIKMLKEAEKLITP